MQWQQNRTRECVHVITDLEEKKWWQEERERERENKNLNQRNNVYKKRLDKKKGLKSKLREFKRIFDVYQKRKAALRLGRQ